MARTKASIDGGVRLADYLTVGFLAMNCPLDKVKKALEKHEAHSKHRRGLPHEVLVYFVMAMCLYANVAYEEVLRLVAEGLRHLLGDQELGGPDRQQRGHFTSTQPSWSRATQTAVSRASSTAWPQGCGRGILPRTTAHGH